ncbi:MAG: DUF1844 domain-containing protein [Nitrospiraceae bacterium]|nr:DUF1844 domain-containing protein [Nitrospiraceae bacterium]
MSKDFEVRDKRVVTEDSAAAKTEGVKKEQPKSEPAEDAAENRGPLPQADFMTHMASLSSMAYMCLGIGPNAQQPDLEQAKYFIDTLGMLEEKTKGNLTEDEKKTLTYLLYELRMIYVKMTEKKS